MFKAKSNLIKFSLLILLLVTPWTLANYLDEITPNILVQEDISFYEINTCDISLSEFLFSNIKYAYQKHYFFNFNSNSPIKCFGKIVGVNVKNDGFYISIGTNPLLNLLLQSAVFLIGISFIKKDHGLFVYKKIKHNIAIFLLTYLFTFSFYAEQRFYSGTIYNFQFNNKLSYLIIFIIFYWINSNLIFLLWQRINKLLYFLPISFLFQAIFHGTNLSLFLIIYSYFGIYSIITEKYLNRFNKFYLLLSIIWLLNSTGRYYLDPGKLRGFTNSIYEFNSNLYWIVLFLLVLNGVYYIYSSQSKNFEFRIFVDNFSFISIPIVLISYIGSNFPIINLYVEYYFGLQRNITTQTNPLKFNEWSEKLSWRGMYQSAETIGEFYGLCLMLLLYLYFNKIKLTNINKFSFIFSMMGLYFSDNRTVMLILLGFIIFKFLIKYKQKKYLTVPVSLSFISLSIYIIGYQNFIYPYEYLSTFLFNKALDYKIYYETSSFLNFLETKYNSDNLFTFIFGMFSVISYLFNRSELWALFIARYNPTYIEFLFGTGPLTFGNLYGEINVLEPESFYLPHSSLLSFLVFFGVIGLLLISIVVLKTVFSNRKKLNSFKTLFLIFLIVNVFKNDSLNYIANFTNYLILFLIIFKTTSFEEKKIFQI